MVMAAEIPILGAQVRYSGDPVVDPVEQPDVTWTGYDSGGGEEA
jgi:hypothetical protein